MHESDIRKTGERTDNARVQGQIDRGEVDASADAARKVAQRIENEGGFWGPRKKR